MPIHKILKICMMVKGRLKVFDYVECESGVIFKKFDRMFRFYIFCWELGLPHFDKTFLTDHKKSHAV